MLKWAVVKDVKQATSQPGTANSAVRSSTIKRTPVKKKRKHNAYAVSSWNAETSAVPVFEDEENKAPGRSTKENQRSVNVLESCCGAEDSILSFNHELRRTSYTRQETNLDDVHGTKENYFRQVQLSPLDKKVNAKTSSIPVWDDSRVLKLKRPCNEDTRADFHTKKIRIISPPSFCELANSCSETPFRSSAPVAVLKTPNNGDSVNQIIKPTPIKSILKSSNSCTLPRHHKKAIRNTLSLTKHSSVLGHVPTSTSSSVPASKKELSSKPSTCVRPHDLTDPGFLESSPGSQPSNRIRIKRGELRKLKRLQTNSDKLSRFLTKYYRNYLPNLPEDEEASCSPEEKSIHTFINRGNGLTNQTSSFITSTVPSIEAKGMKLEETEM